MFVYTDNKQVKNEFKKIVQDESLTMCEVARRLNILPQQLNNRFRKSDLRDWLNVIGYELQIEFVPVQGKEK